MLTCTLANGFHEEIEGYYVGKWGNIPFKRTPSFKKRKEKNLTQMNTMSYCYKPKASI